MKNWTEDDIRSAIRSWPSSDLDREALKTIASFARSHGFIEAPKATVSAARAMAFVAAALLLIGFAVLNLKLIADRHSNRGSVPAAVSVPSAPPSPTAAQVPRYLGPLASPRSYRIGLHLMAPEVDASPGISWQQAFATCAAEAFCDRQRPPVIELARVTDDSYATILPKESEGPPATQKILVNRLMYVMTWHGEDCLATGPANAVRVKPSASPPCDLITLVDALTGQYVHATLTNAGLA